MLYTKEMILRASRYKDNQDILMALLKDDEFYTLEDVDILIKKYYQKEIN